MSSASIPPTAPASKKTAKPKAKKRVSDPPNEITIYHDSNDGNDGKGTNGPSQKRSRSGDMTAQSQAAATNKQQQQQQQQQKQQKQQKNKKHRTIPSEEELENYREKVRELLNWETRRLGFAPLTESELNKRNMASGGVKSCDLRWMD
mmetsp:Transcript_9988/g.13711  ORF Transcript_9988/g.13711 Transcript_9988/m.13711 type:complete len:148 (-) Transcript_9988:109-552(-)